VRRRAVTEDCLESEGEERRDLVGVLGGDGADQVDAAVQFKQAAGLNAEPDLPRCDASRQELPARHDPVLTSGQACDHPIRVSSVGFATHDVANPAVDRHAPEARSDRASRL